ncbi:MAG: allophanate hydrolase, partial [Gammaproteobacteria bacterium]
MSTGSKKNMDYSISFLNSEYRAGRLSPSQVLEQILERLTDEDQSNVWISTVDKVKARERAALLDSLIDGIDSLPLYGLPFSVKDNIDVEGEPTTAACPEFEYMASSSAVVVQLAIDAGALYIGKTNLDQFATGLVGVRSPYGIPRNPHNEKYIPGGSSAGAGVSVSTGMVSFAFGTDTGGSGRIPASYNGIVGMKPAPGQLSRRGLVYACRSIDTPTIFANTASDSMEVFNSVAKPDELDPFCIAHGEKVAADMASAALRLGVPETKQLKFFDNAETEVLFDGAVAHLTDILGKPATVDFDVLTQLNDLMFFGSLLAERDV